MNSTTERVGNFGIFHNFILMYPPMLRNHVLLSELLVASREVAHVGVVFGVAPHVVLEILSLSQCFVADRANKLRIRAMGVHVTGFGILGRITFITAWESAHEPRSVLVHASL